MDERLLFDALTADAIAQICVDECGAPDDRAKVYGSGNGYRGIVDWLLHDGARGGEYRFSGFVLGFGGKLRVYASRQAPYVDCYPEDETPDRKAAIERANMKLAALFADRPLRSLLVEPQ